jgi:alkylation response protein AidB-like acyl-CoA dehydrogenase
MDFKLTEEQQMLRDTVVRLVRHTYGFEQREAYRRTELGFGAGFWRQLGDLGLMGVSLPEAYGGFGGGVESLLVHTELGRGLCLEPYLQSVVFAGGLIAQLGDETQKDLWLGQIASGDLQLAVAFEEPRSHYELNAVVTRANAVSGGWRLSGRKVAVIGGHSAGMILVSARIAGDELDENGITLFLIDPTQAGVTRRVYPTVAGQTACELFLDDAFVSAVNVLGAPGNAFQALRYQQGRAIAAQCAEAVGAMEATCELTLDYLKTRKQFGVAIGSFQVLQHRMVDMRGELEQANSMAILAACVADEQDGAERSRALAAAKFVVTRAGRYIAEQSIQLHGGIGLTDEYVGSHYAKHLVMISHQFGDDDHHLQAFCTLMDVA